MKFGAVVVAVLAAASCVRSQTQPCGEMVCPEETACVAFRELSLCVRPEQTQLCAGLAEGDACGSAETAGFCHGGACLQVGCGNGLVDDAIFESDEECDDGNRLSHDGCSSTCKRETFSLDEQSDLPLVAITNAAMSYDESAATCVLFGGTERNVSDTSRTWILVEDRWRLHSTAIAPSPRHGHAMAYDSRRQVTVMYGGATGIAPDEIKFGDTWEFDGTAWTSRISSTAPPARTDHALAYHPLLEATLLFGGSDNTTTWAWDGVDWTELNFTRPSPPGAIHEAMAFDAARGVMVLIVESVAGIVTYELDDQGWREVAGTTLGPPRGSRTELAFDAVDGRLIAATDRGLVEETWSWDGVAWTSVMTPATPEQRDNAALATGPGGRVLRVGGNTVIADSAYSDTARWTGVAWETFPTERFDATVPTARTGFAAAYDSDRRRVVVFGGEDPSLMAGTLLGDTWELGAAGWRPVSSGPPARSGAAMAYDAARKVTVMFGDDVGGDSQTWLWDGTAWSSQPPATGLTARPYSTMVYDAKRQVVVLFGGGATGTFRGDTWEWDGTSWSQKMPDKRPSPRSQHAMAYDPVRETVVLYGGRNATTAFNDTWTWDGTTWTRADTTAVPTARFDHGLAWDPARRTLLLLGGREIDPTSPVRDVWEYDGEEWSGVPFVVPFEPQRIALVPGISWGTRVLAPGLLTVSTSQVGWTARTAYETCTSADHDRDGLVMCDDPDCWAVCP